VSTGTEEPPKEAWRGTLDEITRAHRGEVVTVEVVGRQVGDQVEVDALPLAYLEYDNKDDVVIVAVHDRDGDDFVLRHIIEHPKNVRVHPASPEVAEALDVVAEDGTHTLVMLQGRT
jgi:hypothetical protein